MGKRVKRSLRLLTRYHHEVMDILIAELGEATLRRSLLSASFDYTTQFSGMGTAEAEVSATNAPLCFAHVLARLRSLDSEQERVFATPRSD